ncbi:MAG TPA: hypothetical protein VIM90_12425 [Arenimonas sp.]
MLALVALPAVALANESRWDALGARQQQQADDAIRAFIGQRLSALRSQLESTPCKLSLLETQPVETRWTYSPAPAPPPKDCTRTWTEREQQFLHGWRSGTVETKQKNALRADWPGNFDRLLSLLEQELQPLQVRRITPYFPYGWYEPAPGAEFLLRDGRTVLGVSRGEGPRNGGRGYEAYFQFSVFDVRRLPGPGRWQEVVNNQNQFDEGDQAYFKALFTPPAFAALAQWEKSLKIGRRVDMRVLDPARAAQVQVAPELQALGRSLAERRWARLAYVSDVLRPMIRQQQSNARDAERQFAAQYRSFMARQESEWSRAAAESTPQRNAVAAGVAEGLANAARTQQFWNARAAEAQAMYFHAQHGCRPGFCAGGAGDEGRTPSTASSASSDASERTTASPPSGQAASTPTNRGGAGNASPSRPSNAVANAATAGPPATAAPTTPQAPARSTYFRWGKNTSGGSQSQACSAASAPDRALGGPLTGTVASGCDCKNPGAEWQREIDEARRKLDAIEPGSFAPQRALYTDKITEREEWIRSKGWVCRANFELVGTAGAASR